MSIPTDSSGNMRTQPRCAIVGRSYLFAGTMPIYTCAIELVVPVADEQINEFLCVFDCVDLGTNGMGNATKLACTLSADSDRAISRANHA